MFKFFSDKLNNFKQTVSNTAQALVGNVVSTVSDEEEFSEFVLDDMEDLLISADLGVNYAAELVDKLRSQDKIKPSDVKNYLKEEFAKTLKDAGDTNLYYKALINMREEAGLEFVDTKLGDEYKEYISSYK